MCNLADIFEIPQPSVSHRLKIFREKTLVKARRAAQTMNDSVCTDNAFACKLIAFLDEQATPPFR